MHKAIIGAAVVLLAASVASAQGGFGTLKLKIGTNVRVIEDGLTLEGRLTSVSDDAVTIDDHDVRPGPGLKIERDRGHTGWKGIAIGAGIGAALGIATTRHPWGAIEMFPGAFWGGIIGAGMDRYVTVYDTTSFTVTKAQLSLPPQLPAPSTPIFDGLRTKVGDRVFVTQDGITVTGAVTALTPSRLVVGSHEFTSGTPVKIEKDGDPMWDAAAVGFAVGAFLGASCFDEVCIGRSAGQAALHNGISFAALGALLDWAHHGKTTIYDSTIPTKVARVIPLIDAHRKGVMVSLTSGARR